MGLKAAILAAIAGLAVFAVACSGGDTIIQSGDLQQTGVSATGVGEAIGEPDVMVLTIGVSARRDTVDAAREAAAGAQTSVIDALKANGVAQRDIQTVQFNVRPEFDFNDRGGQSRIVAYVVSNVVTAKVRDLGKAGAAIDAATRAGGNDAVVQGVWFGIDDPTELQKRAREQAVRKAREQAEQLASNAGARLGRLLSISESGGFFPRGDMSYAPATGRATLDTMTPVEPGELKVTVTVNVVYAID